MASDGGCFYYTTRAKVLGTLKLSIYQGKRGEPRLKRDPYPQRGAGAYSKTAGQATHSTTKRPSSNVLRFPGSTGLTNSRST